MDLRLQHSLAILRPAPPALTGPEGHRTTGFFVVLRAGAVILLVVIPRAVLFAGGEAMARRATPLHLGAVQVGGSHRVHLGHHLGAVRRVGAPRLLQGRGGLRDAARALVRRDVRDEPAHHQRLQRVPGRQ